MARRSALIYLAGILDGEGCLTFRGARGDKEGRRRYRESISVGNCDPRLTEWLRATFGGNVWVNTPTDGHRKPSWRWELADRRACELLRAVRPYLLLKRAQADLLIAHRRLARPWGGYYRGRSRLMTDLSEMAQREILITELHVLNRKGVSGD